MTNILDSVPSDITAYRDDESNCIEFLGTGAAHGEKFYRKSKVESMLEAHRKQVLMDAAREVGSAVAKELRRMAEREK